MADNWDKEYFENSRIYHGEMNDIIDAIKHKGSEAELMHTFYRSNGDQAFKIDAGTNDTRLYGQNTNNYLYFHNVGMAKMYSSGAVTLESDADNIYLRNDDVSKCVMIVHAEDQTFKFNLDSDTSQLFGGIDTGKNLLIKANDVDDTKIEMEGLGDMTLTAATDIVFEKGAANQTFKFANALPDSRLYGGTATGRGLLIQGNESATSPYMHMHAGAYGGGADRDFNIFTKEDFIIKSGEHDEQMFRSRLEYDGVSQSYVSWYAGNTIDTKLFIKPTYNSDTYISMIKDGDIQIYTNADNPQLFKSQMAIEVINLDGYSIIFEDRGDFYDIGGIKVSEMDEKLHINGSTEDGVFSQGIKIDGTPYGTMIDKNYIDIGPDSMELKSEGDIAIEPGVGNAVGILGTLDTDGNNIINIHQIGGVPLDGPILVDGGLDMNCHDITGGGAGHNQFSDTVANEHIDHSTVSISPGTHLNGGGDITATRTLDVLTASPSDGDTINLSTCDQIYDFVNTGYSPVGHNHDLVYLKLAGGTMVGGINMSSNNLTNLNQIDTATDTDLYLNPNGTGKVKIGTNGIAIGTGSNFQNAMSGDIVLECNPATFGSSAATLNAAGADTYTKVITINLKDAAGALHNWANLDLVATTEEAVADVDVAAPAMSDNTPDLVAGTITLTLTYDTDAGATKTYVIGDTVTLRVNAKAEGILGYTIAEATFVDTIIA